MTTYIVDENGQIYISPPFLDEFEYFRDTTMVRTFKEFLTFNPVAGEDWEDITGPQHWIGEYYSFPSAIWTGDKWVSYSYPEAGAVTISHIGSFYPYALKVDGTLDSNELIALKITFNGNDSSIKVKPETLIPFLYEVEDYEEENSLERLEVTSTFVTFNEIFKIYTKKTPLPEPVNWSFKYQVRTALISGYSIQISTFLLEDDTIHFMYRTASYDCYYIHYNFNGFSSPVFLASSNYQGFNLMKHGNIIVGISYQYIGSNNYTYRIRYGSGSSWNYQELTSQPVPIGDILLNYVDQSGTLHFFFDNSNGPIYHYMRTSGGGWSYETIGDDVEKDALATSSIAKDSNGFLHVFTKNFDYSGGNLEYTYGTNKTGSWVWTVLETVSTSIWNEYPKITIDDSGYVYAVIQDLDTLTLRFYTNITGSWVLHEVEINSLGTLKLFEYRNGLLHLGFSSYIVANSCHYVMITPDFIIYNADDYLLSILSTDYQIDTTTDNFYLLLRNETGTHNLYVREF